MVRKCEDCQATRNSPPAMPLHPLGSMFFVVVDSNSMWLEVEPMESTTTEKTLEVLRALFARFGLPRALVLDNGPQFTSKEFGDFMVANGIKHLQSAPYHPATNGTAERFVQTFKQALREMKEV